MNKITRGFQITIPKSVRRIIPMQEGDYVQWRVEDGVLTVQYVNRELVEAMKWNDKKS